MRLLPLYARVFYVFQILPDQFNEVHLDNIYMSTKFAHLSYNHQNCVRVQGVYRTGSEVTLREVL